MSKVYLVVKDLGDGENHIMVYSSMELAQSELNRFVRLYCDDNDFVTKWEANDGEKHCGILERDVLDHDSHEPLSQFNFKRGKWVDI